MTAPFGSSHHPTEIRYRREDRVLDVSFEGGATFNLPAELLRVESPSADVQGHSPEDKNIVGGKRNVGIAAIEPVGVYAIRIRFDDGHDTGLFTWDYLFRLGQEQATMWEAYLQALAARGLSR